MRVYFTEVWAKRRYRGERFVFHAMRDCPSGRRIKGKHRTTRELSVAGRRPCGACTELAAEWLELTTAGLVAS